MLVLAVKAALNLCPTPGAWLTLACPTHTQGEWKGDFACGLGVLSYANGDIYNGQVRQLPGTWVAAALSPPFHFLSCVRVWPSGSTTGGMDTASSRPMKTARRTMDSGGTGCDTAQVTLKKIGPLLSIAKLASLDHFYAPQSS